MSALTLDALERCFGGAIPAVFASASADGVPNVTYFSRAHRVDDERIALSNQFMTKTARNLAVNPTASVLLVDPLTHDEYRVTLVYERTERRGPIFERLRADVDALAALQGMQDVFRLRAADIYRVIDIEQLPPHPDAPDPDVVAVDERAGGELAALARVAAAIGRAGDLDVLVETTLDQLDHQLGYAHTQLLLADADGRTLYTIASRGFDVQGIGAEVRFGDGVAGLAALRCDTIRIASLGQLEKYAAAVRRGFDDGAVALREVPPPALVGSRSRIAVPAMAGGSVVGVLVADSPRIAAFSRADEDRLRVVATLLANAVVALRALEAEAEPAEAVVASPVRPSPAPVAAGSAGPPLAVRYYTTDSSVFVSSEYQIKGVAGRILWSLLRQHLDEGRTEFTNRELRRDASLELPGFKDNLESRLILLKRRLDERDLPIRIERTGRGRFRLVVGAPIQCEAVES